MHSGVQAGAFGLAHHACCHPAPHPAFPPPSLRARAFLERLAQHAAQHGPIGGQEGGGGGGGGAQERGQLGVAQGGGPFSELPVYVAPAADVSGGPSGSGGDGQGGGSGSGSGGQGDGGGSGASPGGSGESGRSADGSGGGAEDAGGGGGFGVNDAMGCVQVPVGASPPDVYAWVASRGGGALAALRARRARDARLEELSARVRARLRLRRCLRDPLLAAWQFEAGAGRLLQHSAVLMPYLEGASVQVSDANRVDGGVIDIAWDAQL